MKTPNIIVEKAFAYVTNAGRLLLFTHPAAPEAGVQVPAGTIKSGETPHQAALREAREETGLKHLSIARFLGQSMYDMSHFGRDETHHRWFFHIACLGEPPDRWAYLETDPENGIRPIRFDFFWAPLSDALPVLIAGHDEFLPMLIAGRAGSRVGLGNAPGQDKKSPAPK